MTKTHYCLPGDLTTGCGYPTSLGLDTTDEPSRVLCMDCLLFLRKHLEVKQAQLERERSDTVDRIKQLSFDIKNLE